MKNTNGHLQMGTQCCRGKLFTSCRLLCGIFRKPSLRTLLTRLSSQDKLKGGRKREENESGEAVKLLEGERKKRKRD